MRPDAAPAASPGGGTAALRGCSALLPLLRDPGPLLALRGQAFADRARELGENGLLPLCHRALGPGAIESLPPAEGLLWRRAVAQQLARSERVWASVADALGVLAGAGIAPTLLKGAHVGAVYYHDRALRPMADLDLFLPEEEAGRAWDLLRAAGFGALGGEGAEEGLHLPPLAHPREGTPVEIHLAVLYAREDRRWARARVLLEETVPLEVCGAPVRGLCPEANLVYTAAHLLAQHAHVPAHAVGLCDIEALVRVTGARLDWERVFWLAEEAGQAGVVAQALRAAEALLALPLPEAVAGRLGAAAGTAPRSVEAGRMADTLADLWNTRGLAGKARKLVRGLFPSPEELRRRERAGEKGPPLPVLYAKRLGRQLRQIWRLAAEKVLGSEEK